MIFPSLGLPFRGVETSNIASQRKTCAEACHQEDNFTRKFRLDSMMPLKLTDKIV